MQKLLPLSLCRGTELSSLKDTMADYLNWGGAQTTNKAQSNSPYM